MPLSNRGNIQNATNSFSMCSDGRGWMTMNVSIFYIPLPSTAYKGYDMKDSVGFGLLSSRTAMSLSCYLLRSQYFLTCKRNYKFEQLLSFRLFWE